LIGFGDFFSGIKNLYDMAGNKLKNFVKGSSDEPQKKSRGKDLDNVGVPLITQGNSQVLPQTQRLVQKQKHNTAFDNILNSNVGSG
jgi:hypothetical protein